MDKTLQTIVGATDTIFFAATAVVADIETRAFFAHTIVPIPETMLSMLHTMSFAKQTIFRIAETIFPIAGTMVSGLETRVFVSDPKVSTSMTMVNASKTMGGDHV